MLKNIRILLPVLGVIIVAIAIANWRTWGNEKARIGDWPELNGGVYAEAVTSGGQKYLVPPDEIYASGLSADDRPALTDPKFDDIQTADTKLADDLEGIAVTVGSVERFYPFQILNWHEIVHDTVNSEELVITYSPLTGSAVVYSAVANETTGERYHFADAGKVYNNALLMVDTRGRLWNQTTGQAIVGEQVGDRLSIYPSTVMSWANWKNLNPQGLALSTDTGFARDYGRHPFASYETSPAIFFPLNYSAIKLDPKDLVYRVEPISSTAEPVVFLGDYLPEQVNPNMVLDGDNSQRFIVAFYDADYDIVRAFDRTTGDQTLTFEHKGQLITDLETGSRWSPEGVAIAGKLRGVTLTEVPITRHYAFAHFAMYPNSIVSGEELLPAVDLQPEGETFEIN